METITDTRILHTTIESPIGPLLLVGDEDTLRGLYMQGGPRPYAVRSAWRQADEPFGTAREQLGEYFAGERTEFDLALSASGSDFERAVWAELERIPYGETASYGEIAKRIGRPDRARAVGAANGRNPISIVVPCHRVIGADGSLTGYGGRPRAQALPARPRVRHRPAGLKTYTLLGADGHPYESSTPGTLGGHRRNKLYGTFDCPVAAYWLARGHGVKHRVIFADEETAIAAGYRPCARCLPERYREWKNR